MAATLQILLVSGRSRVQRDAGTSGKRGDEAGGQNRRVPKGFGENRRLVCRSPRPYFPIRPSGFFCHPGDFCTKRGSCGVLKQALSGRLGCKTNHVRTFRVVAIDQPPN